MDIYLLFFILSTCFKFLHRHLLFTPIRILEYTKIHTLFLSFFVCVFIDLFLTSGLFQIKLPECEFSLASSRTSLLSCLI